MQRTSRSWIALIAILVGVLGSGCQMNASSVQLELHPDGTGTAMAMRISVPEHPKRVFEGLETRNDMTFELIGGPFRELEKLHIGGITATLESTTQGFTANVHVPTTAKAPWFRDLGLDLAGMRRLSVLAQRMEESGEEATSMTKELFEPAFVLEVNLPGPILSKEAVGRELPEGWELVAGKGTNSVTDNKEDDARKVRLKIPLASIHAGTVPSLDLRITCGPISESGREAWKKTKAQLQ